VGRDIVEVDCPLPGGKAFRYGKYMVLIAKEDGRWHLSISHKNHYPGWDVIRDARYEFLPEDIVVAMLLPPKGNYVNVHENCFHLWEVRDDSFERRGVVG